MLEVRKKSSSRATGLDEQSWAAGNISTDGHRSWDVVTRHGQTCKELSIQTSHLYINSVVYVCMYVCMYIYIYVGMYVYIYIYTYVCIYIYVCIIPTPLRGDGAKKM